MKTYILTLILFIQITYLDLFAQISNVNDILPIELLYFEGYATQTGILIRWGTATEVNNFGFEVQRSIFNQPFEGIGFVPGSGNSNSPKHYFFFDSTITESGTYYYRLKQIDYDGGTHFTDTIEVQFSITKMIENENRNFPSIHLDNHLNEKKLIIRISSDFNAHPISYKIYSLTGELLYSSPPLLSSKLITLDYSNYSSGVYFILFTQPSSMLLIQKFLVIN